MGKEKKLRLPYGTAKEVAERMGLEIYAVRQRIARREPETLEVIAKILEERKARRVEAFSKYEDALNSYKSDIE